MTTQTTYIVIPAIHAESAMRIPATWVTEMSLQDAESTAKELAGKHGKRYTELKVVGSFSPTWKISKEK